MTLNHKTSKNAALIKVKQFLQLKALLKIEDEFGLEISRRIGDRQNVVLMCIDDIVVLFLWPCVATCECMAESISAA